MGKKNRKGISKPKMPSSGIRWYSRKRQLIVRLRMKIRRWEKNQADEFKKEVGKSRNNWNVTGLKRHLNLLEHLIEQGPKKRG